ncbi:MAG: response regulator transcription factor [Clostridia bacterium]|nr:response regulator transcription factor [Clostridia bacterium]
MDYKIKVMIVEDDPAWSSAMVEFLGREDDISITAIASTKDEAVQIATKADLDIILMDVNLSENEHDGIYAALEICQYKKTKIIMLTSLNKEEIIIDAFTAGAINYISKTNYREIPSAIRTAYSNTSPLEILVREFSRLKEEELLKPLTPTERELFGLLEKGYSKSQLEIKLNKSENTLKNQIRQIIRKLNTATSREAIKKVKSRGLFYKN